MPVWLIQHDRMQVGSKVPGEPSRWVAEVRQAPTMKARMHNYYARLNNRSGREPIPLDPEKPMWWHRLVGPQTTLFP